MPSLSEPEVKLLRQALFFGVVGIIATIIHVAVAYALLSMGTVNPYVCNALGACSAIAFSFFGNANVTFGFKGKQSEAFRRFLAQSALNFVLTSLILLGVEASGRPYWLYVVIVVLTVPPISFAISKLWVFREN